MLLHTDDQRVGIIQLKKEAGLANVGRSSLHKGSNIPGKKAMVDISCTCCIDLSKDQEKTLASPMDLRHWTWPFPGHTIHIHSGLPSFPTARVSKLFCKGLHNKHFKI